ncbi:MAG: radical SAM protein [Nanoarchaeota archaeon]|nr:radical SAM protein [Nanoarchaeota archaeon]
MAGNDSSGKQKPLFTLQWHVTARCDQRCKHCYMHKSETYPSEIKNELSYEDCKKIVDDFVKTTSIWGFRPRISFIGGDPLLRKDLYQLIDYAYKKGAQVVVLGNPYHVTEESARKMKELGVCRYQVSIDGMEETHDYFRKPVSFKDSVRAIKILNKTGIRTAVMFTLSKKNSDDLLKVAELCCKLGVYEFDFARLIPIGNGADMMDELFSPAEMREFLLKVHNGYESLKKRYTTKFGTKENLWKPLYYELGLIKDKDIDSLDDNSDMVVGGCSIGINYIPVLADGTVYLCRRLPISIGKVPENSFRTIFINSKKADEMRHLHNYGCSKCRLCAVCRGCPAISKAITSNEFARDPQCWF